MNKKIPAGLLLALAMASPGLQASEELARASKCMACHSMRSKFLGPSFKAIAEKRGEQEGAEAALARKIRDGSRGEWGNAVMPPNPTLSEADALALARWILSLEE